MGKRKPTQIGFIPKKNEPVLPKTEGVTANDEKKLGKKEVIAILKEKGIEFDEKAKLEDLKALLPAE